MRILCSWDMPAPTYFTVEELASELRVSRDLVYDLIADGTIPSTKLGKRRIIPRRVLDALVDKAMSGFDAEAVADRLA